MNFQQLLHSVLTDIHGALVTAGKVETGVLGDFNAGVKQIVDTGRQATDSELHALSQLASYIVPKSQAAAAGGVSEAGDAVVQSDVASSAQVTEPSAGEPAPATPNEPAVPEDEVQEEVAGVGDAFAMEEGLHLGGTGDEPDTAPTDEDDGA